MSEANRCEVQLNDKSASHVFAETTRKFPEISMGLGTGVGVAGITAAWPTGGHGFFPGPLQPAVTILVGRPSATISRAERRA
jgi:hypothetical protein